MANAFVFTTLFGSALLVGCADSGTDLRIIVDDPSEPAPFSVTLAHAAAAWMPAIELPDRRIPPALVVFAAESPGVCATLSMGFTRGEEFFVGVSFPDGQPDVMGVAISGPDGHCDRWADGGAPRNVEEVDDWVNVEFDASTVIPRQDGPWSEARVTLDGTIEAELCAGVREGDGVRCGTPIER